MTYFITPTRRLAGLRQTMDRMLEEVLADAPQADREYALALNVQANDDVYEITALVPGLEADQLELEVLNNTVTLRGEFKFAADEKAKFLLTELPHGAFSRIITLPTAVDAAKAEAAIKNGVLTLRIPKAEAHRPKAIKISNN